jgi:hypothetical protein
MEFGELSKLKERFSPLPKIPSLETRFRPKIAFAASGSNPEKANLPQHRERKLSAKMPAESFQYVRSEYSQSMRKFSRQTA